MENIFPKKNNEGSIGKSGRAWLAGYFKQLIIRGVAYIWPAADGTAGQVLATDGNKTLSWASAGAATAWDDIGDPDAAGTIAFGTNKQIITAAKTNDDNLVISGIGDFGDISVVRIESATGDPTDGTVLEVVAHDANVDPLVVSSSGLANALVVAQNTGTVACGGAATVATTLGVTGLATATGGICSGNTTSYQKTDLVTVSNAEIKDLFANPKTLVASPGAGKYLEFISAQLMLDYGGTNAFTGANASVIQYQTSAIAASSSIAASGWIDATTDTIAMAIPVAVAGGNKTSFEALALQLKTATASYAGNAAANNTMRVNITYRVHTSGL